MSTPAPPPTGPPGCTHDDYRRSVEDILANTPEGGPPIDRDDVLRAFEFAYKAHDGQLRKSGEPYIAHPVEVLRILTRQRMDQDTLIAGLLHDTVEDCEGVELTDLVAGFGEHVAVIVDGVTKIGGLKFASTEHRQSVNYRKMLLSMSRDIRVIFVKFADRLHNMRTIDSLPEHKAERIARETLEVYAPLAHRFGMGSIKWELEDLSFKHINPEAYREVAERVALKRGEREQLVREVQGPITEALEQQGIRAEITGRPKHLYSIHRKTTDRTFAEIFDLLGVRVITQTKADCYAVLGVVHDLFTPVHERFKDYIATPKTNMYQSLHTTVVGPQHKMVEIQIRTAEMHRIAELGIAAHYKYKEGGGQDDELDAKLGALFGDGTAWDSDARDAGEFMEILKTSLYQDEVFVFTPKGELKKLPKGSTPLDFAYLIHTDVGHRTVGAKVNGKIVSLRYVLKNGDQVQVITSPNAHPSDEWISIIRSNRARQKVRRWLQEQRAADSVALGRDFLDREARKYHVRLPAEKDLIDVAQSFGFTDVERLLKNIGEGHVSAQNALGRLFPGLLEKKKDVSPLQRIKDLAVGTGKGLAIQGIDNLMVFFARCCQPVPGDQVVGVVTRGRGLSVHRLDCPNAFEERVGKERRMELTWDVEDEKAFVVKLVIHGSDRQMLLGDIANAISATGTNIKNAGMKSLENAAQGIFLVEVKNLHHLQRVIKAVKKVQGVLSVDRQQFFEGERDMESV